MRIDWNDEQMKLMRTIGNHRSRLEWEAKLPTDFKVTDQLSLVDFAFFLKNKRHLRALIETKCVTHQQERS